MILRRDGQKNVVHHYSNLVSKIVIISSNLESKPQELNNNNHEHQNNRRNHYIRVFSLSSSSFDDKELKDGHFLNTVFVIIFPAGILFIYSNAFNSTLPASKNKMNI